MTIEQIDSAIDWIVNQTIDHFGIDQSLELLDLLDGLNAEPFLACLARRLQELAPNEFVVEKVNG